jgi:hypothetical protein
MVCAGGITSGGVRKRLQDPQQRTLKNLHHFATLSPI